MIRNALFASLIAFGAAGAAQAAEPGSRLVNINGGQEVVYGPQGPGNVVGGAYATVTGSGNDAVYQAAPGGRSEAGTGLLSRVENVNGDTRVVFAPAVPSASDTRFAGR